MSTILVIGGTRFAGRSLTEQALAAGHAVTLFHRGRTGLDLFPQAEHVLGDRKTEISKLAGRRFDAVIDFVGFFPQHVRASAEQLRDSGSYTFVSSISAHTEGLPPGSTEDGPTHPPLLSGTEEMTGGTYGPLKVACEQVVNEVFGPHAIVVRPGFIVGPNDPTDRFTALVRRAAAGGEVLVPAPPDAPLQFVDARDLAAFTLRVALGGRSATYNVVHPMRTTTIGEVVAIAAEGADTRFTWVDEEWLKEQLGDERERAFPMWGPEDPGFMLLDPARALADGLVCRPVAETVRDTLAWDRTSPPAHAMGLAPEREAELLRAWHARQG